MADFNEINENNELNEMNDLLAEAPSFVEDKVETILEESENLMDMLEIDFDEADVVTIDAGTRVNTTEPMLKCQSTFNRFEVNEFLKQRLGLATGDSIVITYVGKVKAYFIGKDLTGSGAKLTDKDFSYVGFWAGIQLNDAVKPIAQEEDLKKAGIMLEDKKASIKTVTFKLSEKPYGIALKGKKHAMYQLIERVEKDTQLRGGNSTR